MQLDCIVSYRSNIGDDTLTVALNDLSALFCQF